MTTAFHLCDIPGWAIPSSGPDLVNFNEKAGQRRPRAGGIDWLQWITLSGNTALLYWEKQKQA